MCFPLIYPFSAVARGLGTVHNSHHATKEKNPYEGKQKLLKSTLDKKNYFNVPFVFVSVVVCILMIGIPFQLYYHAATLIISNTLNTIS